MHRNLIIFYLTFPFFCFGSPLSFELSDNEKEALKNIITHFYNDTSEDLVNQTEILMPQLVSVFETSPLEIVGFILNDATLRIQMGHGLRDPAKGALFIQGFGFRMMQEISKESFEDDLGYFCKSYNLNTEVMKTFIEKNDWNRFILYSFKGSQKT